MMFTQLAVLLPLISLAAAAPYGYEAEKGKYEADKDHKEWADKEWADKHYEDKEWSDDKKDDDWKKHLSFPFDFTSTAIAWAGPEKIINNSQVSVPGLDGAYGTFAFGLNGPQDVICWNITVYMTGNYSSPARTATHIHQAPAGAAGPPRFAFPNPRPIGNGTLNEWNWRQSFGCQQGPFTTGLNGTAVTGATGVDTATGFTVSRLESNITNFFADTHTVEFPAGAIRGQLEWKKTY